MGGSSVLARICLFSKIGVIFFLKGVICKTRELFFSAKIVPLCAQISRTMPPSKHLRNMRGPGPYLFTEPLNNKSSSPINCALPPLCATIYYVQIMEHIQHTIRYTYSRNYRAYIPAGHNQWKTVRKPEKKAQEDVSDTDKTLMIIYTCFVDLCGTGTELFFFLGVNMVK